MMRLALLFGVLLIGLLRADEEPILFPPPTADQLKVIREKSLSLLQDLRPASSSGRSMKTMALNGALIYWGNLFDPKEVVALVNLAPAMPPGYNDESASVFRDCWPSYLSLCAWEKDHWVYRQYLDNANSLIFHDRKDSPNHFVQASRKTGRDEGDCLSWYYDPKTKTLVRTNYESWGPFFLIGNYLCTTRGFEHYAREETVWVYPYKEGKMGDLIAINDSDIGNGELRNFSITFRDHQTRKLWTYSFHSEGEESPSQSWTVDAVEGELNEKVESPDPRVHYSAKIKQPSEGEGIDSICFESLTGLNSKIVEPSDTGKYEWKDDAPKAPPVKKVKLEIYGDPEIIRHLNNP